jgi:hypothetical protein
LQEIFARIRVEHLIDLQREQLSRHNCDGAKLQPFDGVRRADVDLVLRCNSPLADRAGCQAQFLQQRRNQFVNSILRAPDNRDVAVVDAVSLALLDPSKQLLRLIGGAFTTAQHGRMVRIA